MADTIIVKHDGAKLLRKFGRLPKEIQVGVRKGLTRGLLLEEERVRKGADLKFTGARSGLISRLTSFVEVAIDGVAIDGVIGFRKTTGFPYELAQEFGAKAKAGGAMAIPVTDKARRAGSPRNMNVDLFVPRKTHVLAEKQENALESFRAGQGTFTVHYVLVKSIAPKLNFRKSVTSGLGMVFAQVLNSVKDEV